MISSSPSGRLSVIDSLIRHSSLWLPIFLILMGAFLRLDGLSRDTELHVDESLYADHARRMILLGDRYLEDVVNDKPPVTYYLVGNSLYLIGESTFAARLPNAAASLLSLALFYALAKQIARQNSTACLALFLYAIAPLDIAYSATVFQDTLMLTAALASLWFASRQNGLLAGLFAGLAIVTKPSGLWLLPLIVGTAFLMNPHAVNWQQIIRRSSAFILMFFIPIRAVIWWDNQSPASSFIELGAYNSNPARLIRPDEVWPRLEAWLTLSTRITGTDGLALLFLIIVIIWLIYSAVHRIPQGLYSWFITLYITVYLGIYWFFAFNIWDRYLYHLTPFALLIVAQGTIAFINHLPEYNRLPPTILIIFTGLLILAITLPRARNAYDFVTDPTTQGIDELATTLNKDFSGTIVYDHWLDWGLRWYLGKYPAVRIIYFPTPEVLAHHMQQGDGAQYFIAPDTTSGYVWMVLLNSRGVLTEPVCQMAEGDYVIYRLLPANIVQHQNLEIVIPSPDESVPVLCNP